MITRGSEGHTYRVICPHTPRTALCKHHLIEPGSQWVEVPPGSGRGQGVCINVEKKLKDKTDWALKIGSKNLSMTTAILKQFPSE